MAPLSLPSSLSSAFGRRRRRRPSLVLLVHSNGDVQSCRPRSIHHQHQQQRCSRRRRAASGGRGGRNVERDRRDAGGIVGRDHTGILGQLSFSAAEREREGGRESACAYRRERERRKEGPRKAYDGREETGREGGRARAAAGLCTEAERALAREEKEGYDVASKAGGKATANATESERASERADERDGGRTGQASSLLAPLPPPPAGRWQVSSPSSSQILQGDPHSRGRTIESNVWKKARQKGA